MGWGTQVLGNFKQAVVEVFSFEALKSKKQSAEENNSQLKMELVGSDRPLEVADAGKGKKERKIGKVQNCDDDIFAELATMNENVITMVTESTNLKGNIATESNVLIAGEIHGDAESKNIIVVTGKVYGDIKARDVKIDGARIEGEITVLETLHIEKDSVIVGDVSANNCRINGHIEGNIEIRDNLEIQPDANIKGDISANIASVSCGAIIQGVVNILGKKEPEEIHIDNAV